MFKDPATFFSAWQVYISIRSSYCLERALGLALFSERIYFHIQLNYPWYSIFNYIIASFRAYQNSASEVWNDMDGILVANNLAVAQQLSALEKTSKSSKENIVSISMIVDILLNQ